MSIINSRNHPLFLYYFLFMVTVSFCDSAGLEPEKIVQPLVKPAFRFSFELIDFETIRFRLRSRSIKNAFPPFSDMRIVILGVAAGNKRERMAISGFSYLDLGMAGPYFTAGPVSICGLLREADNPLGYSPWSGVRSEHSGLKLNGGFPFSAFANRDAGYQSLRHGISYGIFPNLIDIYAYRKGSIFNGNSPLHLGSIIGLSGKFFDARAEILTALTVPLVSEDYAEEWYLDKVLFPGGKLIHLGSRLSFKFGSVKDDKKGDLKVSYSLIGSGGTLIEPGFLNEVFTSWETSLWRLGFFGGSCTEGYRDTEGITDGSMLSMNTSFQILPSKTGSLSLDYKGLLKYPGFGQGKFFVGEEYIASKISWTIFPLLRGATMSWMEGRKELSYSDNGKVLETDSLKTGFLYNADRAGKNSKISIGASYNILESTLGFTYYSGGSEFAVNILNAFSKNLCFNVLYSGSLRFEKYRLYWKVKTDTINCSFFKAGNIFDFITLYVGWATRDQPK
ncbi:MAG: hypothetical protein J7K04_01370 [Spirochaetales bacterium]|nr:hypothetical protein [Spirochaetales bacterium]